MRRKSDLALVGICHLVPYFLSAEVMLACRQVGMLQPSLSAFGIQVGWAVAADQRGLGYATEAARALLAFGLQDLHLGRILALTEPENAASLQVMQKLGMQVIHLPKLRRAIGVLDQA